MRFLQLDVDGFDFDEKPEGISNLDRKISERSLYAVLGRYLFDFLVTKDVAQNVHNEMGGVGLVNVALARVDDGALIFLELLGQPALNFCWNSDRHFRCPNYRLGAEYNLKAVKDRR